MSKQDWKQSQYYQEDFLASHSAQPGSEEARKMTVTSGQKCLESYGNSGPLGLLVRMCLESSIWHSTRCFLTWKRKDTKFNASLFQLAVSMPRTNDIGSQLWPTPSTGAALCGGTGNFQTLKRMEESGLITEEERKAFSQGNGGKTNPQLVEWLLGYEQQFTKLIPTPRASCYKGAAIYDRIKHLAKSYIKRQWISVEEYEDLKRMHHVYHDDLEGNGFLDSIMEEVSKLGKRVN